jgi:septal ring-binding cell division protein DamX
MGRLSALLPALAVTAALAVGLSACGDSGSDLLPGTTASQINSNLDEVKALVAEGNCSGAGEAANTVTDQVAELSGVAKELKEALNEGATRLSEVVAACEEVPNETEEEAEAQEAEEAEREAEEEAEKEEKAEKEKPDKEKAEKEPEPPAEEKEPPGQEKKEEKEEAPPVEPETGGNSGGVGPGAAVEGEQ